MSGHSKWENIKRKKGATDAARAKIFTKIGREIAVVVKQGGADPAGNAKLRDLIAKAKSNNVPNDNIDRIIKRQQATATRTATSQWYTRATVQAVLLLSLSALQTTRTEQQAISVTSSTSSAETWVHRAVYLSCSLTLVLLLWRTTVLTRTR